MIEAPKKKETKQNTEDKTHKNSEIFKKLSKTHFMDFLFQKGFIALQDS